MADKYNKDLTEKNKDALKFVSNPNAGIGTTKANTNIPNKSDKGNIATGR
ncbi:MAG TPA: hypothetical protein PKA28_07685 [Methylomusa anaerophila]|uniref:Uncharacterized protein n=1 Tax=Methylomusa anaerophila TaxID=1930071 RepID=A0A348AFW2_9FIRM|nr:hypothetical protein [Methylomusa anaerophila]BBB89960.1 hypothetical protein MAMMFC1_00601 [Methylomusa anaerophila]HML88313.1 hypothetical protein [Methylomusa anaerophila]